MRGQIGDGYFGWVSNAHLWICSGGEFHGVGRTGYKQLLFSGKQENHRNGLKIFFFRATGTISTSSLSMPPSGSQALLFTLGITSCRCVTTNFERRFQVLLHKLNSLFFRTFWLRTSSQKTVIVWLFLRRCWQKGWSAIRPSILMQRIW